MFDPSELLKRIALLEEQIQSLINAQAVPPLHQDSTYGIGTVLSIDESVLADNLSALINDGGLLPSDLVVKIVTGTLVNGKYDVTVEPRDSTAEAWTTGDPAWGIDLAGSTSLTANDKYIALIARDSNEVPVTEVGGEFYIAIQDSTNEALTDTSYWIPKVGSSSAWSGVTAYVAGNVVTDTGDTYICILGHTNHEPPNSTYWKFLPSGITNQGAWTATADFLIGDEVQEARSLYAFQSPASGSGITSINGDTTAAQQITIGDAGTKLNVASSAAAYDNAKTYAKGWVVSSGGSTYRFINATPSAGHSPPNATYWEDVTGQGLSVVNVPHRCPDIDEIGGVVEITGKNTTTTWTSPDCPITATIEAIGQGADAGGPGGVFGYVNAAGGGGAYARVNSYSIPANTTYNIEFDYAYSYGARFSTVASVTVVNAAPGNGAAGGLASSSTGDVKYNGGDGYVDGSTLNGGGGGSGFLYANGNAGTITAKGTGTGNGGDPGIEKTHTYSSTFVIPSVSGSVTVTVLDTSGIVIADPVYILGLNGSTQKVYLTGTAAIIDATTFTFTLTSITHGSVGDTVVAFAKILQTNPTLSDAQSPGGGAGGIPFPSFAGANSEIPYVPQGGNGLIRISWGPGVRLLNGKTGAVTLNPESGTGLDVTADSNNNGLQLSGPLVSGKLPVSTGGTGRTTLDSGQLLAGAGTSAVDSLSSTRVVGETIELKIGSDSWIAFSEGSF